MLKYLLVNGLMVSNNRVRNIELIKSNVNRIEVDNNVSMMKLYYVEGSTSNDLASQFHDMIGCYNDEVVDTEGKFIIDKNPIDINGIRVFPKVGSLSISQFIVNDPSVHGVEVIDEDKNTYILVNYDARSEITKDEYIETLNKSSNLFVIGIDEEFVIANFTNYTFTKYNSYSPTNIYFYSNEEFVVDESVIVSHYIDFLKKEYPHYKFFTAISKAVDEKTQEEQLVLDECYHGIGIYYVADLASADGKFHRKPWPHPEYDTTESVEIKIKFEYITDDTTDLIKFRHDYLEQRVISNKRDFTYSYKGFDLSCGVFTEYRASSNLTQKMINQPKMNQLVLQSFQFDVTLYSKIIRKSQYYPRILTYVKELRLARGTDDTN